MSAPLVDLRGWSLAYRRGGRELAVVRDVTLELTAGRVLALVGESGSGKSTLGLSMLGLNADNACVTAGELVLDGHRMRGADEAAWRALRGRVVALQLQDPLAALDPLQTVGEQVLEGPLHVEGLSRASARERALATLAEVGLDQPELQFARYPHELSGGMRQRVLLACALATRPKLLVADEPTSALDAELARHVLELLRTLSRSRALAVLWITHDLAAALEHADEIAVMYAGALVERGGAREIAAAPLHPYTAALLRSSPARVAPGVALRPIPGRAPEPGELPGGCAFRERCSFARASCAEREPALLAVVAGRACACPYHTEVTP